MKKYTARILMTLECNRSCDYCANKSKKVKKRFKKIKSIADINYRRYDEVCITGGEPFMCLDRTEHAIRYISEENRNIKIFLYTTYFKNSISYKKRLRAFFYLISGVNYTIHKEFDNKDIRQFTGFQKFLYGESIEFRRYSSDILIINKDCDRNLIMHNEAWEKEIVYKHVNQKTKTKKPIQIYKNLWSEIRVKHFIGGEDCYIPMNEDLYLLT